MKNKLILSVKVFIPVLLFFCLFILIFFCGKKSVPANDRLIRTPADTVGFAQTAGEIEAVIAKVKQMRSPELLSLYEDFSSKFFAGICPHDDHLYAGKIYVDLLKNIDVDHVIIFGVAHRAADWGIDNKLIFDNFDSWEGPFGEISISNILDKLLGVMDSSNYIVSNKYHSREHSIEALLPFLQYYNKNIKILPILVPPMKWKRLNHLAEIFAAVVSEIIVQEKWKLGSDIGFLISTDCVHYGNEDWGGKNFADFGVDQNGYEKAVRRDHSLIDACLTGEIQPQKLEKFLYSLIDRQDINTYKITWCGRFSIPYGLNFLYYLKKNLKSNSLTGYFLSYGTSIEPGKMSLNEPGLGVTASASLKHWVGYCAVGYH